MKGHLKFQPFHFSLLTKVSDLISVSGKSSSLNPWSEFSSVCSSIIILRSRQTSWEIKIFFIEGGLLIELIFGIKNLKDNFFFWILKFVLFSKANCFILQFFTIFYFTKQLISGKELSLYFSFFLWTFFKKEICGSFM